jgi:DNA-directed RNA polymerase subunit M/transcription elongation factor TFIIS
MNNTENPNEVTEDGKVFEEILIEETLKLAEYYEKGGTNLYECPKCHNIFLSSEWDKETMRLYMNRKDKRHHIGFDKYIKTHVSNKTTFKCPSCKEMIARVDIKKTKIDDSEIIQI